MAGAAVRWRERAAKGMNDDELGKALATEIGVFGADRHPTALACPIRPQA